jgi:hypothetical protein
MAPAITKIGTDIARNAAPITSRVLGAVSFIKTPFVSESTLDSLGELLDK